MSWDDFENTLLEGLSIAKDASLGAMSGAADIAIAHGGSTLTPLLTASDWYNNLIRPKSYTKANLAGQWQEFLLEVSDDATVWIIDKLKVENEDLFYTSKSLTQFTGGAAVTTIRLTGSKVLISGGITIGAGGTAVTTTGMLAEVPVIAVGVVAVAGGINEVVAAGYADYLLIMMNNQDSDRYNNKLACERSKGNDYQPNKINLNDYNVGNKYRTHKYDYPDMKSHIEYRDLAEKVFKTPDMVIFDELYDEYYYLKGNDLLRLKPNGNFISLYPGAKSDRVINAINALN